MHWPNLAVRATHCGSDLAGLEVLLRGQASFGSTHPQTGRDKWAEVSALAALPNRTTVVQMHNIVHNPCAKIGKLSCGFSTFITT